MDVKKSLSRLLSFCVFVWLYGTACCKTINGIVSSRQSWNDNGTFVAKFCFHDRKAVFRFECNITVRGRWYFYLDEHWDDALAETDCNKKLAKSRFSVGIQNTQGQQYVSQWLRPHFWYVVYGDPDTCREAPPPMDEYMGYTLYFLNPDSYGEPTDHFGDDEKGLLMMYTLLVLLYLAGISFFAKSVWQSIQKGGPMHMVLQMLSVAIAMHFFAAFFMLIHLWIFKNDGEGSGFCETVSEMLDVLAQLVMVWMLLSMSAGWTLGSASHPVKDKRQFGVIAIVGVAEVLLVLWEQSYDEAHYTYHAHDSFPGFLICLLRILLACLFAYNLHDTMSQERSALRKTFYQSFSFACYLWFLSFPVLMMVAMALPQYWRHRVVTIGTVTIQSITMLWLSRQFLSRSLYWEVSSLSSTTLPFKKDRGMR